MRASVLCASLAFCVHALPASADVPGDSGQNCGFVQPPEEAPRIALHGQLEGHEAITFPVTPGSTYSGCLWLWVASDRVVKTADVIRFRDGKVVAYRRIMQFTEPHYTTECIYEAEELVRRTTHPSSWEGDDCPPPANLRVMLTGTPAKR